MTNSQVSSPESTLLAWSQVIDSLLELSFDGGISVQDVVRLIRKRSVRAAADRIARVGGQASFSRIAIITGLPRSEVARQLKALELLDPQRKNLPASSVIEAWHSDPAFHTKAGRPAVLPIFGRDRTFERLVRSNGRGTPVRAMLDQLLELRAITVLDDSRVRVKTREAGGPELSAEIASLGVKTADFIETLKKNIRKPSNPLFERTTVEWADAESLPQVKAQIVRNGIKFANNVALLIKRSRSKLSSRVPQSGDKRTVGVTVFYFERKNEEKGRPTTPVRRKNLKRTIKAS